jgi:hypothetical protein
MIQVASRLPAVARRVQRILEGLRKARDGPCGKPGIGQRKSAGMFPPPRRCTRIMEKCHRAHWHRRCTSRRCAKTGRLATLVLAGRVAPRRAQPASVAAHRGRNGCDERKGGALAALTMRPRAIARARRLSMRRGTTPHRLPASAIVRIATERADDERQRVSRLRPRRVDHDRHERVRRERLDEPRCETNAAWHAAREGGRE